MSQSTAAKSDKTDQQADEKPPLWELIPLAEFKPPSSPAPEAVRSGLHDLWRRLRGGETANNGEEPDVEMERPSQRLLGWAAPEPDGAATELAGLEAGLRGWLDGEVASVGVQTDGGATVEVSAGDVVYAPPGELHWHGAGPHSPMVHLSLTTGGATVWEPDKVTDAEYERR